MAASITMSITENSQSVANNTTRVTVKVSVNWTYGTYNATGESYGSVTIDGKTYPFTGIRFNTGATTNGSQVIMTQTVDVGHNADGTKTLSCSAKFATCTTYGGTPTTSATKVLTTIARASSVTAAAAVTLGNACSVRWTPHSAAFRYKLRFALGSWSHTTGAIHPNKTTAYTYTGYTIPLAVADQLTAAATGTMTVTLYTYSNSGATTQVGAASSTSFTVTVPKTADTLPTLTMSLAPNNSVAGFAGVYVQRKSRIKATLSGTGKLGATVTGVTMTVDGTTYTGTDGVCLSGYLAQTGSVRVTGTVTDSRGFSTSVSNTVTVIPYTSPGVSVSVCGRCDENGELADDGTSLKLCAKRTYSKVVSDGVQKNFCTLRYRYKTSAGTYSNWASLIDGSDTAEDLADTVVLSNCLAVENSYVVQVGVVDTTGAEKTVTFAIPTDKVYSHEDGARRAFAFGSYVEEDNTFTIAEDIALNVQGESRFKGSDMADFVVEAGTSGIWSYRKWYSGLAECWGRAEFLTDATSQWGSLYVGSGASDRIAYPITFATVPAEQVTVRSSNWAILVYPDSGGRGINTTTQTAQYRIVRGVAGTEITYHIDYFVSGRWK